MGKSKLGLILLAGLNLVMLLCVSCVFYAAPVQRADQINKEKAILYGRFDFGHHFKEEISPTWFTTGLWVRDEVADRTLYIQFKETNKVYAVQVVPGKYRITGLVRSDNKHGVEQRVTATNLPAQLAEPFEVRKGEQIYIGDYQGENQYDYPMLIFKLKDITNNFVATTLEFRKNYPALLTSPAVSIFDRSFRER